MALKALLFADGQILFVDPEDRQHTFDTTASKYKLKFIPDAKFSLKRKKAFMALNCSK